MSFAGDEIVAATIHLDHLKRNEVLEILKVLEPYDDNMKIVTKKDLQASADLGSLTSGLQRHLVVKNIFLIGLISYFLFRTKMALKPSGQFVITNIPLISDNPQPTNIWIHPCALCTLNVYDTI